METKEAVRVCFEAITQRFLDELRITMKLLGKNSRFPGRDSNQ
jgi:hypothetical protein